MVGICAQEPPGQQAAYRKLVCEGLAQLADAADPLLPSEGAAAWRSLACTAQDTGLPQVRPFKPLVTLHEKGMLPPNLPQTLITLSRYQ